jgi:hypothetical protein
LAAAAHEMLAPRGFSVRAWAGRFIVTGPTGRTAIVARFDAIFGVALQPRVPRG